MKPTETKLANTMNREYWMKWANNVLIFSAPAVIIFLTALQQKNDLNLAWGAAYQALITALIDLLLKYKKGVE
jgi:hypothetical protein